MLQLFDICPRSDISDRVFSFASTRQIFTRFVGVFTRKLDFGHLEDSQALLLKSADHSCKDAFLDKMLWSYLEKLSRKNTYMESSPGNGAQRKATVVILDHYHAKRKAIANTGYAPADP